MKYKHILVTHPGGLEKLQIKIDDLPEPKGGEVRVKVQVAGVSFADLLMREGVHPESWFRWKPYTPGWDLVGFVDKPGAGVTDFEIGQVVSALPVVGGYSEYACLRASELLPVPSGLDLAEALCMVNNYATAYQMLHRSAKVKVGERILIHSAAGGIGTALLQLGRLAGLDMYGTASLQKHDIVNRYGGIPIDYKNVDFVKEIQRLTGDGVDVAFDGVGGGYLQRSYKALRQNGRLIAYGLAAALQNGHSNSWLVLSNIRDWMAAFGLNLYPDGRKVKLYSIQTLKRQHPDWYREDLAVLFDLLAQRKIEPLISARMRLTEAIEAQALVASGSVTGKILLIM